jgi:TRAP-type C4-dicarboxylate transport system permease small subunit
MSKRAAKILAFGQAVIIFLLTVILAHIVNHSQAFSREVSVFLFGILAFFGGWESAVIYYRFRVLKNGH